MSTIIEERASILTPAIDHLIKNIAALKNAKDNVNIALLRSGSGAAALACAGLIGKNDSLHIFDHDDKAKQLAKDLGSYPCQIKVHGHSHKLYDSAIWQLAKLSEQNSKEGSGIKYDLVFVDGPGMLWQDGLSLQLIKGLLAPGAMLIFARPDSRYAELSKSETKPFVHILDIMTQEQANTPQQQMAIDLLVKDDPAFEAVPNAEGCVIFKFTPQEHKAGAIRLDGKREEFVRNFMARLPEASRSAVQEALNQGEAGHAALVAAIRESNLYDTEKYLEANPDVKAAGLDPVSHFLQFGIMEGRRLDAKGQAPQRPRIIRAGAAETFHCLPLHVNWGITDMCNYKCSYCFGQKPLDKSRFSSLEQLKKAIDHIAELNRDQINFAFGGGEPTTHPHLGELIEYIHNTFMDRLQHIHIISNGSRNPELYDRLANTAAIDRVEYIISLHTEFMSLGHITELIRKITPKSPVHFSLMVNPEKMAFVKEIHAELCRQRESYPFTLGVTLLRGGARFDRIDERYKPEDFEWQKWAVAAFNQTVAKGPRQIRLSSRGYSGGVFWNYADPNHPYKKMTNSNRSELLRAGDFCFKNMYCVPGTSIVCIEPGGLAYGAQACIHARKKYNIFEENPYRHDDFITPVKCSVENCGCAANDTLPKFASEEEAKEFARMYNFRQAQRLKQNL